MEQKLKELQVEALQKIEQAEDLKSLNDIRVAYLGKKGPITEVLRGMGQLSAEERPKMGALANEVRESISEKIEAKQGALEAAAVEKQLASETIDITLPGRPVKVGNHHPLTKVIEEIEDLFIGMGYQVAEGPEVEKDYYNFEALNLPKGHPARDMQDSFYITEELLLRTHTSPVQARTMEKHEGKGPVKIICPGKVYRRDNDDATHSHQFMQIEGLVVDENITMGDLKGTLQVFAKKMFGEDREIRLRPSFFPFTEPSVEMDITCKICGGEGCNVCKGTGWIEILGAGMVHPNVLEMAGFDSKKYTGFAFGMGPERIAMLKYGIDDIRHFYTNDIRFLKQFAVNE
ncbi:MAG: phenylalanine--tRNA ligase subunit alpha [Heyndrickxia sp.]